MEINVRLSAKDVHTEGVFDALERLCLCFKPEEYRHATIHPPKANAEAEPMQSVAPNVPAPTGAVPQTPTQRPAIQQPAPTTPVQAPAAIPTAAPQTAIPTAAAQDTFTIQQAAQAAAIYAETSDAARNQVVELIHSFGVNALNELPQDKLGAFVTSLRGLGARI